MLTPSSEDAVYTEAWGQEVCTEAARVWQAEIVKRAIDLNRAGDYREAKRFAKEQLRYFRHYAKRLDEGEELVEKLERALHRMARPMRERARKEIGAAMHKRSRGVDDHRVMEAPRAWDSYLED